MNSKGFHYVSSYQSYFSYEANLNLFDPIISDMVYSKAMIHENDKPQHPWVGAHEICMDPESTTASCTWNHETCKTPLLCIKNNPVLCVASYEERNPIRWTQMGQQYVE